MAALQQPEIDAPEEVPGLLSDADEPEPSPARQARSEQDAQTPQRQVEEPKQGPGASPQRSLALSVDAPAFRPKPHTVTLFHADEHRAESIPCDLATLTIADLQYMAEREWGHAGFDLWFGSEQLADISAKAIDVGISNRSVVLLRSRDASPTIEEQWAAQQQQLMQYNTMTGMAGMTQQPMYQVMPGRGQYTMGGPSPEGSRSGSPGQTITRVIITKPPQVPSMGGEMVPRPVGRIQLDGTASDEFFAYALSNEGARALVTALETVPDANQTIEQVAREPKLALMSAHQHGSKVMRVVARLASAEQAALMLTTLSADLVQVAESTSGSDVLCDLIEKCADEAAAAAVVRAMVPAVLGVCCSVNGRKVLLSAIQCFPPRALEDVYAALGHELLNISTDQCGCITLQRVLDHTSDPSWRMHLHAQIVDSTHYLINDPYGNYILQHVVKDEGFCSQEVARRIEGRLIDVACNKFSSNVVERCLQVGPDSTREMLIEELLQPTTLQCLMNDAYGNFVVQSSVDNAPAHLLDQLRDAILPLTSRSPYGYRIESKLQRRLRRNGGRRPPRTRELPYGPEAHGRAALGNMTNSGQWGHEYGGKAHHGQRDHGDYGHHYHTRRGGYQRGGRVPEP